MSQFQHLLYEAKYSKENFPIPDIAIVPWGATEAHNYHLPYGTDNYLSQAFAEESARKAAIMNVPVTVLPVIPFGVNTGQLDIPLTINMNPSTQTSILEDIIESLRPHGVKKLVVFNGHGGNDFKQIIRQLQGKYADVFICQVNWYQVLRASTIFEDTGEHAGEMETSLMMYLFPHLVLPLSEAGNGKARELVFKARNEGWMWAPRAWTKVTDDTGIGNPEASTPEKGHQYFEEATGKIADFFRELHITSELYK
ncbi:MAG: creatininase family protein [Bacteroidetes bacterium]|nr:creatininase family protein [Bacteroidota bacterium]